VERVPERVHDVVRHVDDVGDRAHSRGHKTRPQPGWRGFHPYVAEEAADVARAAFEILDRHVHRLVARAVGLGARRRPELELVERGHLACDSVDREEIRSVRSRLELQDGVGEREHLGQRRPGLPGLCEDENPRVVGAELELALGEDHPVRDRPSELRPFEPTTVGQDRARQRDRDRRPLAEIPRSADDLARLVVSHVDGAELETVGVGMLGGLENAPDPVEAQIAVLVGHATPDDPLDPGDRDRQPLG
jgi:hypothetical protein